MTNTGSDRDESVSVRGEDQPTTLPNTEHMTTATQAGIEISVTTREQVMAGSRLWFDVVVRNGSDAAVFWQAGGCAIPVTGALGPESRVSLDAASMDDARWNGQVDSLGAWLAEHNTFSGLLGDQPEDATAIRELFCTSDSRLAAIEPGQAVHYRGSVEVRVPPGPLLDGGAYALVVGFQPYATPGGYPYDPMELVTVRAPVTVIDDPERGSDAAAISAFARDGRLATWIASTAIPDRPDLVQDFATELSWWRGAWELSVSAQWEGNRVLRMRYDPTTAEVVDVRTVYRGNAPGDEPDAAKSPGAESDNVIPPEL